MSICIYYCILSVKSQIYRIHAFASANERIRKLLLRSKVSREANKPITLMSTTIIIIIVIKFRTVPVFHKCSLFFPPLS